MARTPFVAGNWKMNTLSSDGVALATSLVGSVGTLEGIQVAACPPFTHLAAVGAALKGSRVALGAQNMYFEDKGAFTGEVSAQMLLDCGCRYVIVGHSERRHVLRETDAMVNQKVIKALAAGLLPILCVGETIEERKAKRTMAVIERHVAWGLYGLTAEQARKVAIAYEPVWAIGTGVVAEAADANEVHTFIRKLLGRMFGDAAAAMPIQYGGSVRESNTEALAKMPEIDGFLVGGASLAAAEFAQIVLMTRRVKCGS